MNKSNLNLQNFCTSRIIKNSDRSLDCLGVNEDQKNNNSSNKENKKTSVESFATIH